MTHIPGHRGINGTAGGGAPGLGVGGQSLPGGGRGPGGGPGISVGGPPPMGPPPVVTSQPQIPPVGGIDQRTAGDPGGGGFWEWVQNNPEVSAGILGTGVEAFGAYQEGKGRDRDFEESQRRYDEERQREDEKRERRRMAYDQILTDRRKVY